MIVDRRVVLTRVPLLLPALVGPARVSIELTQVDDIPFGPDSPPVFFVEQHIIVVGRRRGPAGLNVQALKCGRDGHWRVLAGHSTSQRPEGPDTWRWSLPVDLEDQDRPESLLFVCVDERIPPGIVVDGPRWRQVVAHSDKVEVSCQRFDRSRLEVIEIAGQVVLPGVPVPVSDLEEVRIRVEGLPYRSIVQILTAPANNPRVWPSERLEVTRDSIIPASANFGRILADSSAKRQVDIHQVYGLWCHATVWPLPPRPEGISPQEQLRLSRYIKAESPRVSAVRAIIDEIQLRVSRLGVTNDGIRWLAPRFSRVEGTFMAGSRYRPLRQELVTLLVRRADSRDWWVASATTLASNRALWVLPVADLLPAGADPERDSMIAVAVASYVPFDTSKAVNAADIGGRAIALSKEVSYRIVLPRRLQ